jgi:hypothetical protein
MSEAQILEAECMNTIINQLAKYSNNEYMMQRIRNHVVTCLPTILENELKAHEERVNRNTYLTNEQQVFIQVFLSKNKYFYLPNNNLFYEYDGQKYLIIKEDDIIHNLLSSISKEKVLLDWKHKTKTTIIKQIKERNLFSSIPETDTIQNVLNVLYPAFFSCKNAAKYFLTIVGDNILKKNQHVIFLVTPQMKQFLNEIDNVALASIGNNNTAHNFMTKYHENHSYENCRLIKINDNFSNEVWRELLKKIGLDLLCVAAHYSKRYENSDIFIENKSDEEFKNYTYYLKNTNHKSIVEDFCNKYMITTSDCEIEWKNLHFVWKQFLSSGNLPNVIYSNSLKQLLKDKFEYNEETDCFAGITSKYLPAYRDFIKFWENTIEVDKIDSENSTLFDNEIEVDELSSLFKVWAKEQKADFLVTGTISEENIVKILKHFFPNVEIMEDKYVLNVSSKMWNKVGDIESSFSYMREQIKNEYKLALISFDDAYNCYYKFCYGQGMKNIVSKRYFEKYLYFKLSDHIVYEKFIETKWFDTI